MDWSDLRIETLSAVWRASWQAGALALTVLALRFALGRRLSAQWRCRLWMLVMLRLMLPAIPSSPWSAFNVLRLPEPVVSSIHEIQLPAKIVFIDASEQSLPAKSVPIRAPIDMSAILFTAWLGGLLIFALWLALANFRFGHRIGTSSAPPSPETIKLFRACAVELGITRVPEILATASVSTPSLYGVFRRRLLIPNDFSANLSEADAQLVFLHELAHMQRNDLPAAWIAAFLRTVHWFNPLVWIAVKTWRTDMESACDDVVLSMIDERDHARYGMVLMKLATPSMSSAPLPALGITGGAMQLRQRIIAVSRFRRPAARWSVAAAAILGLILALGLTDARGGPANTPATGPSDSVARVYDIADLMTTPASAATRPSQSFTESIDLLPIAALDQTTATQIADWVRESINSTPGNRGLRIDTVRNSLIVTAPLQTQKEIAELLTAMKDHRPQVRITAQFLSPDSHVLATLKGQAAQIAPAGSQPFQLITPDEANRLLRNAGKISHAPRTVVWSRQSCEMYQLTFTPYVAGVHSETVNGRLTSVPIIEQAKDGIVVAFQPDVSSDKRFITLALGIKQLNFFGFTTVSETRGKETVKCQVPIQVDTEVNATIQIPDGFSALMPLRKDDYAIVTPNIVAH